MKSKWTALLIGVLMGIDFIGTPIGFFAVHQADTFAHESNRATVRSRYEDCVGQEQTRRVQRTGIEKKKHNIAQTLRLIHVEPTPHIIRLSTEQADAELALVAPVNCTAYANKAKA